MVPSRQNEIDKIHAEFTLSIYNTFTVSTDKCPHNCKGRGPVSEYTFRNLFKVLHIIEKMALGPAGRITFLCRKKAKSFQIMPPDIKLSDETLFPLLLVLAVN